LAIDYVCASILNTKEGYTAAYTLKGICIQMLSFFGSEYMEDLDTGEKKSLSAWRERGVDGSGRGPAESIYHCDECGFGLKDGMEEDDEPDVIAGVDFDSGRAAKEMDGTTAKPDDMELDGQPTPSTALVEAQEMTNALPEPHGDPYHVPPHLTPIAQLSSELLLHICDYLDASDLVLASRAYKKFSLLQTRIISLRELQCFVLKTGFMDCDLGLGVHVDRRRIESEFDLMSEHAFDDLRVRRSVQGLSFEHWLPLPLAQRHWDRVKGKVGVSLRAIARDSGVSGPLVNVL